jgi:hypothetical protein
MGFSVAAFQWHDEWSLNQTQSKSIGDEGIGKAGVWLAMTGKRTNLLRHL